MADTIVRVYDNTTSVIVSGSALVAPLVADAQQAVQDAEAAKDDAEAAAAAAAASASSLGGLVQSVDVEQDDITDAAHTLAIIDSDGRVELAIGADGLLADSGGR